MRTVKENLIAAKARILDPENWAKGGGNGQTTFCAAVACNEVAHDTPEVFGALCDALPAEFRKDMVIRVGNVFRYNDDPSTTHADIMALFDRAIAAQDEK